MSKISEQDVEQIAQLARLELSGKEIAKYQSELSNILGYAETIQSVDTKNVEPTAQVTGLSDVVREDVKNPSELTRDDIFANTPEKKDGYLKVKAVLD
jgi:aspartyl-tRNA(Asn)/glutamyl-tRNA(Gln) amidotransferase subunit C